MVARVCTYASLRPTSSSRIDAVMISRAPINEPAMYSSSSSEATSAQWRSSSMIASGRSSLARSTSCTTASNSGNRARSVGDSSWRAADVARRRVMSCEPERSMLPTVPSAFSARSG
jgi:hypothetical protein